MAYEALVVIGFGVSLAVVSVALFVAHVKRINAPNRADPTGIVVHIDLASALAKDEAARTRKVASRRSIGKHFGGKLGGGAVEKGACENGVDRRRGRPCATSWGQGQGGEDGLGSEDYRMATCKGKGKVNDATSTTEDTQV